VNILSGLSYPGGVYIIALVAHFELLRACWRPGAYTALALIVMFIGDAAGFWPDRTEPLMGLGRNWNAK